MRVGIDARSLSQGPGGVATYVSELKRYLPQLIEVSGRWPLNNFLWNQTRPPLAGLLRGLELFHSPGYTAPLWSFCPLVVTAHDVSYLAEAKWYPYPLNRARTRYYLESLYAAQRIIVSSEFTASELSRVVPELVPRVRPVPLGVDKSFQPVDPRMVQETREKLALPDQYLLHVGDIHARRNLEVLYQAAAEIGLPLLLVGRVLQGHVLASKLVRHLSTVSQPDLISIYAGAKVFAYPSLYEGFGLPLLEAMACGVPVVASKRSSIPEVVGDAAILVEPTPEEFIRGIHRAFASRKEWIERGLQRAAAFPWKKTAQLTEEVYREVA